MVATAAFKSCNQDQAFIFLNEQYIVVNYDPQTPTISTIVYGPIPNAEGMYCLTDTVFANKIDCAFSTTEPNNAFIFSDASVALLEYSASNTPSNSMLVKGPMPISQMFPFLANTIFETGIDAAFVSSVCDEAYLFKGDQYGRINYGCDAKLMLQEPILQLFPYLKGSKYAINLDAAFASDNKVYLFKSNHYTCINFTPSACNDNKRAQKINECRLELSQLMPHPKPSCN